jgi:hypothetical protein
LYVPRVITRFQEAKTSAVLSFIMPPSEKTMGWKGRLLLLERHVDSIKERRLWSRHG